jgi:formate-dependent nitrite reductase cytochrome c552 subunit
MKRLVRSHVSFFVLLACGALMLCAADSPETKPGPPPLVIEEDAPALSDAMPLGSSRQRAAHADNSACYVCHANLEQELLVSQHAVKDVGCVKCHGDSFEHRNDENNTTPPQIMFPRERIDAACRECHETHDVAAAKVIATFLQKCPRGSDLQSLVCTDCHGDHRLAVRTVRWDKTTGKLISVLEKKSP